MALKLACLIVPCLVSAVSSSSYAGYDVTGHHKKSAPRPYSFAYGVRDQYRGTEFERTEESDGIVVIGSYSVQLPDGRTQTVKYEADAENGFVADVSYYGEAQYPPPSKEPPFVVRHDGYTSQQEHYHPHPHPHNSPTIYHNQHYSPPSAYDSGREISQLPVKLPIRFNPQNEGYLQPVRNQEVIPTPILHPKHASRNQHIHKTIPSFSNIPNPLIMGTGGHKNAVHKSSYSEIDSHPEIRYRQPSPKPKPILPPQNILAHEPFTPRHNSHPLISQEFYNHLKKIHRQNNVTPRQQKILNTNILHASSHQPPHHKNTELRFPTKTTQEIANSKGDLFIPQFIKPSLPRSNPSLQKLLKLHNNPFRAPFQPVELSHVAFHNKRILDSNEDSSESSYESEDSGSEEEHDNESEENVTSSNQSQENRNNDSADQETSFYPSEEEQNQNQSEEEQDQNQSEEEQDQNQSEDEQDRDQSEKEEDQNESEEEQDKNESEEEQYKNQSEDEQDRDQSEEQNQNQSIEEQDQNQSEEEQDQNQSDDEQNQNQSEEEQDQSQSEEEQDQNQSDDEQNQNQSEEEQDQYQSEEEQDQNQSDDEQNQNQSEEEHDQNQSEDEQDQYQSQEEHDQNQSQEEQDQYQSQEEHDQNQSQEEQDQDHSQYKQDQYQSQEEQDQSQKKHNQHQSQEEQPKHSTVHLTSFDQSQEKKGKESRHGQDTFDESQEQQFKQSEKLLNHFDESEENLKDKLTSLNQSRGKLVKDSSEQEENKQQYSEQEIQKQSSEQEEIKKQSAEQPTSLYQSKELVNKEDSGDQLDNSDHSQEEDDNSQDSLTNQSHEHTNGQHKLSKPRFLNPLRHHFIYIPNRKETPRVSLDSFYTTPNKPFSHHHKNSSPLTKKTFHEQVNIHHARHVHQEDDDVHLHYKQSD